MAENSYWDGRTLIEMWITCLNRVSANSGKGRGSRWAVRVGQRLHSRFGQSGEAPELVLVQIAKEAREIRGGSQTVSRQGLFLAVVVRAFFGDYGVVLSSRTAVYKLYILEKMMCS